MVGCRVSADRAFQQWAKSNMVVARKRKDDDMKSKIFTYATSVAIGASISISMLACSDGASGEPSTQTRTDDLVGSSNQPAASSAAQLGPSQPSAKLPSREWRRKVAESLPTTAGCYKIAPSADVWESAPCSAAPNRLPTHRLPHGRFGSQAAENVGNGNDLLPMVASQISSADGTFPSTTNLTTETDGASNVFTLQLNTNFFSTTACAGHAGCTGWQQFIFDKNGAAQSIYMQEWLINWGNSACPAGLPNRFGTDCWGNTAATTVSSAIDITDLSGLELVGHTSGGGDVVVLYTPSGSFSRVSAGMVNLFGSMWNSAEFNVFGNGGGSQATFNNNATIAVRLGLVTVDSSVASPICQSGGTTGETNNLNLVPSSCCPISGVGSGEPAITFLESNAAGTQAPYCMLLSTITLL